MPTQMRSLVQRTVDSEKWAERLMAQERVEYWSAIPYSERSELRRSMGRELASMGVKREVRALEFVVLEESDKTEGC